MVSGTILVLMNRKRMISPGLCLVIFLMFSTLVSCKSRKALCEANRPDKVLKMKKNKSSYNTKFSFKTRPVRKAYVIRNGRR